MSDLPQATFSYFHLWEDDGTWGREDIVVTFLPPEDTEESSSEEWTDESE
jgi:hypothetical protein